MKNNLEFWDRLKHVPKDYQKTIGAGRLKGMTDIKPQWRIQVMTEVFGMCGIGWKVSEPTFEYKNGSHDQIIVNCRLALFVKVDNEWSEPIYGTGGSAFVVNETKGLYTSDEAEKMAFTDALSVAMKMLGVGAEIYLGQANTKYSSEQTPQKAWFNPNTPQWTKALEKGATIEVVKQHYQISKENETKYIQEWKQLKNN